MLAINNDKTSFPTNTDKTKVVSRNLINLLPFFGFLLGGLMWLLDAVIDVYFINPDEKFLDSLFAANPTEMWMRTFVILVMVISSFVVQYFLRKQYKFEVLLLRHQQHLEQLVDERTRELQELANIDVLTKIYNRRKFNNQLEHEVERARRYKQPLSIALFDLDHFKHVNDTYGHTEGDVVLSAIADMLRSNLRQTDIYARWGGEEFIILMPHTGLHTAVKVAEKLRGLVNTITYGNDNETISASFGVSQLQLDEQLNPLIKRADDALYEAKNNGRNQVCMKE